jgi:vacuolar-type H+-ATPase subunit I/STV1
MRSPLQVASTPITGLLIAVAVTSILFGAAPIGPDAGTVATVATIFGVTFQIITALIDDYGKGNNNANRRAALREHVDDLGIKLRKWTEKDTFRWETYTEDDRSQFDDAVVEYAEQLVKLLDELATINDELNKEISKTLQAKPRLLEECLPPEAVRKDGGEVVYRWQGRHSAAKLTAYEWLVQCGYPLMNADSPDLMIKNLRKQVTRIDIEFELEHWDEFETVWETDWKRALWSARDADVDTVWDVVEDNRELLQRQQALTNEIHKVRVKLLSELSELDSGPGAGSTQTAGEGRAHPTTAEATQKNRSRSSTVTAPPSESEMETGSNLEIESETE